MKQTTVSIFLFFVICGIQFATIQASCFGNGNENTIERDPQSGSQSDFATCCWQSDSSCCILDGVAVYLEDIQNSLNYFAKAGVSESCYYALANLECILCNPDQSLTVQYAGERDDNRYSDFFSHKWIMRICDNLCSEIYSSCNDEVSAGLLGATDNGNPTDFCESIDLQNMVANPKNVTGMFFSASLSVSQFDCYPGTTSDVISGSVGTCLVAYEDAPAAFYQYLEYYLSSNSSSRLASYASIFTILSLLLVAFMRK